MNHDSAGPEVQLHTPSKTHFVQTDRAVHELWGQLSLRRPAAAGLLHYFAANVDHTNVVVMSQKALARVLKVTDRTIRNAVSELVRGNWLQVVRLGAGRECAYVLNDRVAWTQSRDNLRLSRFSAVVIADADDQTPETLHGAQLHRLPRTGEGQLLSGNGLPPVSQPFLTGMEPDLPATSETDDS